MNAEIKNALRAAIRTHRVYHNPQDKLGGMPGIDNAQVPSCSLWPDDLLEVPAEMPPGLLLAEQAYALREATDDIVTGHTVTRLFLPKASDEDYVERKLSHPERCEHYSMTLEVRADHIRYATDLLSIAGQVNEPYPVHVLYFAFDDDKQFAGRVCETRQELEAVLAEIFAHPETRALINSIVNLASFTSTSEDPV